jgi:phosphate starvation-inducible PhoH-like protein
MACEYLYYDKVKKIIITRPMVEAGRSIGYLPGTSAEKSLPYMIPIIDELNMSFDPVYVQALIREGIIEILPLAYMRGRNFHNRFVIADEMSNATDIELKLLLTRIGNNCKMIINGDIKQSDLPHHERGALDDFAKKLENIPDIAIVRLYDQDIIRNPIIAKILERLS